MSSRALAPRPAQPRARIELVGVRATAVRLGRNRLAVAGLVFAAAFSVLSARLVALTAFDSLSDARMGASAATAATNARASVVDRDGRLLAANLHGASLYADASQIGDPARVAQQLRVILPSLPRDELVRKLSRDSRFVWLKRGLTPLQHDAINRLGVPGLHFRDEPLRIYPHGRLAAHVLGHTDTDGRGTAGVEKFFDHELRARARDGSSLQLSIDLRIQHALHDELARARDRFRALGAAGVVMDISSGEVLALASLPDFDPNHPSTSPETTRFNRATLGVYELGSVFKPFTVAMALDAGTIDLGGGYDATKPIRISRFLIRDDHAKKRWLSVPEILIYSSNIGAAKMAMDVGGDEQLAFMRRLGLLRRATLELPELGAPLRPRRWGEVNIMTAAYGHGISVTPLQLTSAFGALVNGGVLMPPTLRRAGDDLPVGQRVIAPRTSDQMRRLLRLVVSHGTGGKADVPGFAVGGKTGTAEKATKGGYRRNALLSSFIAAFPMTEPRYAVYVLLDEPKGDQATHGFASAGWTAAPLAGRVIARIAPLLGVTPLDMQAPDVRDALRLPPNVRGLKLASF